MSVEEHRGANRLADKDRQKKTGTRINRSSDEKKGMGVVTLTSQVEGNSNGMAAH